MLNCPICNGYGKPFHEITKTEYGKTSTAIYERCPECKTIYITNPISDTTYYDGQYFEKFKQFAQSGTSEKLLEIRSNLMKGFNECFNTSIDSDFEVLDYGCGSGDFLNHISKLSKVTGVEINKNAIEFIKTNYPQIIIVDDLNDLNGKKYNVITCFDVVEHFADPLYVLETLDKKLKPGGLMILSTPYLTSRHINASVFEKWRHCRPAEHFVHLTTCGILKLCETIGYEMIHLGFEEDEIRKPGDDALSCHNIITFIIKKPLQPDKA